MSWASARNRAYSLACLGPGVLCLLVLAMSGAGVPVGVGTTRAGCPAVVVAHTDADFAGGSFVVESSFPDSTGGEEQIAAVSYMLTAADFPVTIELIEVIIATSGATETTTTQFSVIVWSGTPDTGTRVSTISSNGSSIPHIVIGPGTNVVNRQVDPGNPSTLTVIDDGSHTFSVGFRIDLHNNQTQDPCSSPPSTNSNAFPTTDVSGLLQPTQNWLRGRDCGPFGCPSLGGWARFSELSQSCRPTGDWVIRATYTPDSCPSACGTTLGDVNGDDAVNGEDVQHFVDCLMTGTTSGGDCDCADVDENLVVTFVDVEPFVVLLTAP